MSRPSETVGPKARTTGKQPTEAHTGTERPIRRRTTPETVKALNAPLTAIENYHRRMSPEDPNGAHRGPQQALSRRFHSNGQTRRRATEPTENPPNKPAGAHGAEKNRTSPNTTDQRGERDPNPGRMLAFVRAASERSLARDGRSS